MTTDEWEYRVAWTSANGHVYYGAYCESLTDAHSGLTLYARPSGPTWIERARPQVWERIPETEQEGT